MSGKLIIVGTPIGNLADISLRALAVLQQTEVIACEDTRRFGMLLKLLREHFPNLVTNFSQKLLISYRDQNHSQAATRVISALGSGQDVVLVSDSGMPLISDPGFKLVQQVLFTNFEVDVVPGPTAVTTALVVSGLPTDKFSFVGFLPRKESELKRLFATYLQLDATVVAYESPLRILKTLKLLAADYPTRELSLVCELTKAHQRSYRGRAEDILQQLRLTKPRGEMALLISKASFT